jgi:hypothetical protein
MIFSQQLHFSGKKSASPKLNQNPISNQWLVRRWRAKKQYLTFPTENKPVSNEVMPVTLPKVHFSLSY